MSEYAIQVKDVSKMYKLFKTNRARFMESLGLGGEYEPHYALHHMNFDIKKGETVGLIGTNGAGKSTILKIITGVITPTEGELIVDGRISALLELGAGFNYEYNGIENIYLNGTMLGFTKEEIDARLQSILDFADIGDYVYQPVRMYSSGMFVRLAFAVAINIDPEILIVDEALSVGDVFFQAKCYNKFEEFKKMGKTILFVSHDLSSISRYCDRVVLLDKGHKLSEGTPKDMIDLYKKVLVHQVDIDALIAEQNEANGTGTEPGRSRVSGIADVNASEVSGWKKYFTVNPNLNEYGSGSAAIIDYCVEDEKGRLTPTIEKGTMFTIRSKVRFFETVHEPIFTFTFKNIQGVAITGTNTKLELASIPVAEAGETYVCSFKQKMNLQGGDYLLSISCTGYVNGEFVVYHRLYDVLDITVVSSKDSVGFYDMESEVDIVRADDENDNNQE